MARLPRLLSLPVDALVTLLLWLYFILVFLVVFLPIYLVALLLPWHRAAAVQRVSSLFFSGFFGFLRLLAPAVKLEISKDVRQLRSAVLVCNHQSYLDPILLVSIFRRQATIVKPVFFRVPVFGWLLDASGYMGPATQKGGDRMLGRVERMSQLLEEGGVIFVFPEGSRSRDGSVAPFKPGAFKLARLLGAPVEQVLITGTGGVFRPGRLLFRTCTRQRIRLTRLGSLDADTVQQTPPAALARRSRADFIAALASSGASGSGRTRVEAGGPQ